MRNIRIPQVFTLILFLRTVHKEKRGCLKMYCTPKVLCLTFGVQYKVYLRQPLSMIFRFVKVVPPGIVTYLQVAVYHYFSESH